ncbi:hypothetical protein Cgig2_010122 [Carnegiea gigantea]|uniref:Uncharacterized protein n=1 Tax=Carnegiea gigantea TaxID=171969 RepID=A0A9Q1JQH1_9CARY|nr:hypothetical protein Cgig2_010122 [Carnegiea gigantea]
MWNVSPQKKVHTELLFDNLAFEKKGKQSGTSNDSTVASMVIDKDTTVVVGSETFKRKQDDVLSLKQGDKKRRPPSSPAKHHECPMHKLSGWSGGLGLLWTNEVNVNFLSSSSHHIDITIQWEGDVVFHGHIWLAQTVRKMETLLLTMRLYDLVFSRYEFMWCNCQHNGIVVAKRLDHFYPDTEWSLIYPEVK